LRVQATTPPGGFEVTTDGAGVVSHAGAALLGELADRVGLTRALGWHQAGGRRRHLDAAVLRDVAVMLADGGDCLSDLAVLRDQPELFGPVASTPTAWRVVERIGKDPNGLARLRAARAHARARAWAVGAHPDVELLIVDADATLIPRPQRCQRGRRGQLQAHLRVPPAAGLPGPRPRSRRAAGRPAATRQRPRRRRRRSDRTGRPRPRPAPSGRAGAAGPGPQRQRRGQHPVRLAPPRRPGWVLAGHADRRHLREAILTQPEHVWTQAINADGQPRAGAEVCELTGWLDLHTWPEGTRAICRREDAHPGAQLRFTDHDGHRFQVFLTDQPGGDLAALELRHRQRARVEDRIRAAKATGLRNLPFDRWRRNAVWLELVLAAQDLTCWTQALLLDGDLAVAEPKTLRYRLLHTAARIVRHARRVILRRQRSWPWATQLARAFARLRVLALRC